MPSWHWSDFEEEESLIYQISLRVNFPSAVIRRVVPASHDGRLFVDQRWPRLPRRPRSRPTLRSLVVRQEGQPRAGGQPPDGVDASRARLGTGPAPGPRPLTGRWFRVSCGVSRASRSTSRLSFTADARPAGLIALRPAPGPGCATESASTMAPRTSGQPVGRPRDWPAALTGCRRRRSCWSGARRPGLEGHAATGGHSPVADRLPAAHVCVPFVGSTR